MIKIRKYKSGNKVWVKKLKCGAEIHVEDNSTKYLNSNYLDVKILDKDTSNRNIFACFDKCNNLPPSAVLYSGGYDARQIAFPMNRDNLEGLIEFLIYLKERV